MASSIFNTGIKTKDVTVHANVNEGLSSIDFRHEVSDYRAIIGATFIYNNDLYYSTTGDAGLSLSINVNSIVVRRGSGTNARDYIIRVAYI